MSRIHRTLAIAAAAFGCALAVVDSKPAVDTATLAKEIDSERDHISALDLAERIMHPGAALRIFDLRTVAESQQFHIPGSRQSTLEALAREALPREATIILYSEGGTHAAQAWVLLRLRGYPTVFVLREGLYEWISRVMEPRLAIDATASERAEFERAVPLSRFFGGSALAGVPRAEVPAGYWTGAPANGGQATQQKIAKIRRRGC